MYACLICLLNSMFTISDIRSMFSMIFPCAQISSSEIFKDLGPRIIYCRRKTCIAYGSTLSKHHSSAASLSFVLFLGFETCTVSSLYETFEPSTQYHTTPENPTFSVQNFGHQNVLCSTNSPSSNPLSKVERSLNILLPPNSNIEKIWFFMFV